MMPAPACNEIFQRAILETSDFFYHSSSVLHRACHYAMMGQGKRVRPLLCLWICELLGKDSSCALAPALALEWVHTYSLVHDDLPSMDNDDFRRGRATVHRAFSEDIGILVGDALLTDAFAILAGGVKGLKIPYPISEAVQILSTAAGSGGMALGQSLDLYWTRRDGARFEDLTEMHRLKTGALIRAACELGALAAGADEIQRAVCHSFGEKIGLMFQIKDDLIDQSSGTGKTPGKDAAQGKLTFLSFMELSDAKKLLADLREKALLEINGLGKCSDLLEDFVKKLSEF